MCKSERRLRKRLQTEFQLAYFSIIKIYKRMQMAARMKVRGVRRKVERREVESARANTGHKNVRVAARSSTAASSLPTDAALLA